MWTFYRFYLNAQMNILKMLDSLTELHGMVFALVVCVWELIGPKLIKVRQGFPPLQADTV
jgi:hypothetical protein